MVENTDIFNCEAEPIRFPGAVQPHGVLLVLNADSAVVEAVSESCQPLLGLSAEIMLGQPIERFLDSDIVSQLLSCVSDKLTPIVSVSLNGQPYTARPHLNSNQQILIDIEPTGPLSSSTKLLYKCRQAITDLRRATELELIATQAAELVREMTGFDRVMIYRFDEAWNGEVIAEARIDAIEPYLGLNFPASDIPRPTRELFKASRLRQISDTNYSPSTLIALGDRQAIDLGQSSLRSVSPLHIEYLANMGVQATLVGSLVVEGALWGLVSCQHKCGTKYFDAGERDALGWLCEDIASLIEGTLIRQRRELEITLSMRRRQLFEWIRKIDFKTLIKQPEAADLLGVVNADGFALLIDDGIQITGCTPATEQIRELQKRRSAGEIDSAMFVSNSLESDLGSGLMLDGLAGALFVCLPGKPDITMIWFRMERHHTLHWGGDPHRAHFADAAGRMSPRKSFDLFLETVRGQCLPWLAEELNSAAELGSLIEIELLRQRDAFTQTILNSIPENVAVLNAKGIISMVNAAWKRFAQENGAARLAETSIGMDYKSCCESVDGAQTDPAWAGIEAVLNRKLKFFTVDYPCDSPAEQRWFRMSVYPLLSPGEGVVIAHENITLRKLAELALSESEERFRQIFENNATVMGIIEPSLGMIVDVNAAAVDYYGYPRERLIGMSIDDLNVLPPNLLAQARQLAMHKERNSLQLRHRLASGQIRDVEVHSTPIKSAGRELLFSIVHDVSERVAHAERIDILLSEQKAILGSDLVGIVKIHERRIKWSNAAFNQMLGYEDGELNGQPTRLCFPSERDYIEFAVQAYPIFEKGESFRTELQLINKAQVLGWYSLHTGLLKPGGDELIGMLLDITDHKQAELAQRQAHERLQKIASRLPGVVYQFRLFPDGSSCFPYASDAVYEIYRVSPAEIEKDSSSIFNNIHPDDLDNLVASIQQSANDLSTWIHDYRVKFDDGTMRWLHGNAKPEREADKSVLWHGFITDITEHKQAEEELAIHRSEIALGESRQRLRDLVAQLEAAREEERKYVARELHDELGQVLTALRMSLLLAEMRFCPHEPALATLISDMKVLLDRAIQGTRAVVTRLRPIVVDMGLVPAIEWLCQDFSRRIELPFELNVQDKNIPIDEARSIVVFRIVQESLTNIARYADARKVNISIQCRNAELAVEIHDNGRGFDVAAARQMKSYGLIGMRERALALGGRIEIESELMMGTTVRVAIPLESDTSREQK